MTKFVPSVKSDIPQIIEWTKADIYHRNQNFASWWLTGNGLLAYKIVDDLGPVFYVRMDHEGLDFMTLNVQFAPVEQVSKKRVVLAILEVLPRLIRLAQSEKRGLIFDSESPSLIEFMGKQGFIEKDGRYVLPFGE